MDTLRIALDRHATAQEAPCKRPPNYLHYVRNQTRTSLQGKGSFGAVYLGLLSNGKFVSAKTIEFGTEAAKEDLEVFQAELTLMKVYPNGT